MEGRITQQDDHLGRVGAEAGTQAGVDLSEVGGVAIGCTAVRLRQITAGAGSAWYRPS